MLATGDIFKGSLYRLWTCSQDHKNKVHQIFPHLEIELINWASNCKLTHAEREHAGAGGGGRADFEILEREKLMPLSVQSAGTVVKDDKEIECQWLMQDSPLYAVSTIGE